MYVLFAYICVRNIDIRMKNIARYILVCLLLSIAGVSLSARSYTFRELSVADGLSDLVVNALYKDSAGFLWIGTGADLERFDGVRIKHYAIPGSAGKLKRVNVITETDRDLLWMGNGMGLWRLDRSRDALERIAEETISTPVRALLYDHRGTLYIGSGQGLFIHRNGQLRQVLVDPNHFSAANRITGLLLDEAESVLWMTTERGLCSLRLADLSVTTYPSEGTDRRDSGYNNLARIGSTLYLGTMTRGIVTFDLDSHTFDRFISVGCNVISSLSSDGRDILYVGTDGNGVHFVSVSRRQVLQSFRHEQQQEGSLRSNSVYSLLVDRDGLIWVGLYQLGLNYTLHQNRLFNLFTYPPYWDSKDMPIRTIAVNGDEMLVGSRDGLFYIDKARKRFKSFTVPQLRTDMIFCSHYFGGIYYIGTYGGGMYLFDPATLALSEFDAGTDHAFGRDFIFRIQSDAQGYLWIGTSNGLYRYKDGKLVAHYTSENSRLPDGNVYEIFFDSTQKGWICTENGMCIWNPDANTLVTDLFPEGFVHQEKIRMVYEDSAHNLYFLPDKGTLFVSNLSMTRFHRIEPHTPLEGKDCVFIIEDDDHWLWIGTSNGLYRYDKQDNFVLYGFTEGVPSPMFFNCYPAKGADGSLWFGNAKGLITLDASRKEQKERWKYPIAITDVFVNGVAASGQLAVKRAGEYALSLDRAGRSITIYVSGFSYTTPASMTYEYKMEGRDADWQRMGSYSSISYYELPAGRHDFRVRYADSPDSEVLLRVNVASTFPVWPIVSLLLAVLAGVLGVRLYRRERALAALSVPVASAAVPDAATPEPASSESVTPESASPESVTPGLVTPDPLPVSPDVAPPVPIKYKTSKVSDEDCRLLLKKLEAVMQKEKPYTDPGLKVDRLAALVGTSGHTLSYTLNQYLSRSYYDYVNEYRLAEFKRLASLEEYSCYTLMALAELCGFNSRASFFRYFKDMTGITPSDYVNRVRKRR